MAELFLSAELSDDDLATTLATLKGHCGTRLEYRIHRVLIYSGPPQARGLPDRRAVHQIDNTSVDAAWQEIDQNLKRQSYHIDLRYDITAQVRQVGESDELGPMDFDGQSGSLKWTDLPDVGQGLIMSRSRVVVAEQKNLVKLMADNQHTFHREMVELGYTYHHDEVEFVILKACLVPGKADQSAHSGPVANLPSLDNIQLQGPLQSKWLLQVRTRVEQRNHPELVRKARQALMDQYEQLKNVFSFEILDRRVFDTRIMAPRPQGNQSFAPERSLPHQSIGSKKR